jgi:hypothetical protein
VQLVRFGITETNSFAGEKSLTRRGLLHKGYGLIQKGYLLHYNSLRLVSRSCPHIRAGNPYKFGEEDHCQISVLHCQGKGALERFLLCLTPFG